VRDALKKWPLFEVRAGSSVSNGRLHLVRVKKDELLDVLVRKYVEHVSVMQDVPEHAR
jgi:hypothetical protein